MTKLAIMIAEPVHGVALEAAVEFAARTAGGKIGPDGLDVILGLPFDAYREETLRVVRAHFGGQVRDFGIELTDRKFLRGFFDWRDDDRSALYPQPMFARPRDKVGGFDFLDCSHWLFWNTPSAAPVAGLRPYAAGHHLAFPRGFDHHDGDRLAVPFTRGSDTEKRARAFTFREARACFSTSAHVAEEITSIYGAPRARVFETGPLIRAERVVGTTRIETQRRPYVLLPVDTSALESLDRIGEAIDRYILMDGGELDIVFAGPGARRLQPERADGVRAAPSEASLSAADAARAERFRQRASAWSRRLQNRLTFHEQLDEATTERLVRHAVAVWLPQLWSDRDLLSVRAARAGIHVIAADLPMIAEVRDRYGMTMTIHDGFSPQAAADALMTVQRMAASNQLSGGLSAKLAANTAKAAPATYAAVLERLLS